MCRSRRELSNAYFLSKFGFDTAENEPSKVCCRGLPAYNYNAWIPYTDPLVAPEVLPGARRGEPDGELPDPQRGLHLLPRGRHHADHRAEGPSAEDEVEVYFFKYWNILASVCFNLPNFLSTTDCRELGGL